MTPDINEINRNLDDENWLTFQPLLSSPQLARGQLQSKATCETPENTEVHYFDSHKQNYTQMVTHSKVLEHYFNIKG